MDYFSEGEGQFLVMQYILGKDLGEQLSKRDLHGHGPFPVARVLDWAEQLLEALDYLHSHPPPIIHRDIKPQNLKLTPRDEIILLDFGLAKGATAEMSQANPSLHGLTPGYAPLEQIDGSGTEARSDLYSLAATLYHLLTGRMPPKATTRATALLRGNIDPLRPVQALNPQVPTAIAAVLWQAMSPRSEQRPSSAAAMKKLLQTARHHSRTVATEGPTSPIDSAPASEFALPPTEGRGFDPPIADLSLPPTLIDPLPQTTQPDTLRVSSLVSPAPPTATAPLPPPRPHQIWVIGLLLGMGVLLFGAWFAYRLRTTAQVKPGQPATVPVAARVVVLRYYVEVETGQGRSTIRLWYIPAVPLWS